MMLKNILLVGFGGGVGSVARFCCQKLISQFYATPFPLGTFLINVVGCLAIGMIWGFASRSVSFASNWQLFLMTGLCGGYTTFSAFGLESVGLIKDDRWLFFLLYVAGSVLIGIVATYLGIRLTK